MKLKLSANRFGVAAVEAVLGELLLLRQPNFSVSFVCRPPKIVDARGVLDELANPFEPVSQLHGNRVKVNPSALLEISELSNLQSIQQHLPANAPSPKCRRFPVVFLETNVVFLQSDSDRAEALKVKILHVGRRRFQDDLKLRVLVQAVGILTIPSVGGPTAGLRISNSIRRRSKHAQKCFRMHRAGSDLHIIGLLQNTSLLRPEVRELQ